MKRSQVYGDADPKAVLDEAKMKAALAKAVQWQQQEAGAEASTSTNGGGGDKSAASAAGKRGYNSMAAVDVTPEDMEVWRLKRLKEADPAAAWIDGEALLEYEKKK